MGGGSGTSRPLVFVSVAFVSFSFIVVQPFEFTSAFVYPVLLACCGSRSAGWMSEVVSIGGERDVKVVRLLINVSFFRK